MGQQYVHGLCENCWQYKLRRDNGQPEQSKSGWSLYYERCIKCGTAEKEHYANGMCYDCYEETKREERFGADLGSCPVCGIKVAKLQQHVAMKSKKCTNHRKFYNKFYNWDRKASEWTNFLTGAINAKR